MSYSSEVLSDSPVVYLRLDDTSGSTLVDSSGNNRDAATIGSPALFQAPAGISIGGKSVTFASGQYATIPDDAGVSVTGAFSLEAWVNPTSSSSERYILEKYENPSPKGFALRLEGMVPRAHILYGTSFSTLDATTSLVAGTWSHLVVTYDLSNLRIYINGVLSGTLATAISPLDGISPVKIAARGDDSSAQGIGGLDEIAIYSSTLSQARITSHYDAANVPPVAPYPASVLADTPQGYWRLGETSGTTAADSSGNNRSGTYINSPTLGAPALQYSDNNTAMSLAVDSNQAMSVTSAAWMDSPTMTVEAWVKFTNAHDSVNGDAIVSRYNTPNFNWLLWRDTSGKLAFQIRNDSGTAYNITDSAVASVGTTYHVVGAFNGSFATLHINGVNVGSAAVTGTVQTGGGNLEIGRYSSSNVTTPGAVIDEVAFYSYSISGTRVAAHYAAGTSIVSGLSNKVLWVRAKDLGANGSSVSSWGDQSGASHNGTSVNTAPTVATNSTPIGGKSVRFAGSGYLNFGSLATSSAAAEVWMVVRSDGGTGPTSWELGTDTGLASHYPYSGTIYDDALTNTRQVFTPSLAITSWRIYRVTNNGTSWNAYIDGALQKTSSGLPVAWPTSVLIGSSTVGGPFGGNIAEILVRTTVSSTQEETDLMNYFVREHFSSATSGIVYGTYTEALGGNPSPERQLYGAYAEALSANPSPNRQFYGTYTEVLTSSETREIGWGARI